jgi:hypothetical protein
MRYVVESPVLNMEGERVGTARVWVLTQERARQIADSHPPGVATWRPVAAEGEGPQ